MPIRAACGWDRRRRYLADLLLGRADVQGEVSGAVLPPRQKVHADKSGREQSEKAAEQGRKNHLLQY